MGVAVEPASRRLNVLPAFGMERGCELRRFVMHSCISFSRSLAVLPSSVAGVSWNVAERIVSALPREAASSWKTLWR